MIMDILPFNLLFLRFLDKISTSFALQNKRLCSAGEDSVSFSQVVLYFQYFSNDRQSFFTSISF